jgi:putative membrane protein
MLEPILGKNDQRAARTIGALSIVVALAVFVLSRVTIQAELSFDPRIFATINAWINSIVALGLLLALVAVKQKEYTVHRNIMLICMLLSVLFLCSYIAHHLFTEPTPFGGTGIIALFYYVLLITHIILAAVVLPFILYTAYRGATSEFSAHKRLARITWPLWLYVAVSGVVVYLMISPYYATN